MKINVTGAGILDEMVKLLEMEWGSEEKMKQWGVYDKIQNFKKGKALISHD